MKPKPQMKKYLMKHNDSVAHEVLHLPMGDNDADAATVGEYLGLLLSTLWLQGESFSGKRPFGNSSWHYPVYVALVKAGIVPGEVWIDYYDDQNPEAGGYEELEMVREAEIMADELILQAIRLAYYHGN